MFTLTNEKDATITTGKVKRTIIEQDAEGNWNVSIDYECGYMLNDEFVNKGVDHIMAIDKPAYTDDDGNEVAAQTGYTDFLTNAAATGFSEAGTEAFIMERI